MKYQDFIRAKRISDKPSGLTNIPDVLNPMLFDYETDIVKWSLRRGRAGVFAGCGMGKTPIQLAWSQFIPGRVLISAPLAVSAQTVREGNKFGVECVYRRQDQGDRITVTNYEMLDNFDPKQFTGIVLDESGILKNSGGAFRNYVIDEWSCVPFRLACTATPAPNDFQELGNHAEFLGVMTETEMKSMFFVHDGGETSKWRLRGHAQSDFWRWLCSWSVMIQKPSDLGYSDEKHRLPPLNMHEVITHSDNIPEGCLFPVPAKTLQERISTRRATTSKRCERAAELANASDEQWLLWCNMNNESETLAKAIPDAVEIKGSDSIEKKEDGLLGFQEGRYRVLVSKPSIAGFGMNFQCCHNVAFVGLNDSYEQFYQAVRRCWRFGQTKPVNAYIIISDQEGAVLANIKRKEADAQRMAEEMIKHMGDISSTEIRGTTRMDSNYYASTKMALPTFIERNQYDTASA